MSETFLLFLWGKKNTKPIITAPNFSMNTPGIKTLLKTQIVKNIHEALAVVFFFNTNVRALDQISSLVVEVEDVFDVIIVCTPELVL